MNTLFFIARRYLLFKKSTHLVHIISWISILSIAVCTASLITVLSVFNGIDGLIKTMYNQYSPPLKITPQYGKIIYLTDSFLHDAYDKRLFRSVSRSITLDALLQKNGAQYFTQLQGVDAYFQQGKFETSFLQKGSYFKPELGVSQVLISEFLAHSMGIDLDMGTSDVTLYTLPLTLGSQQIETELSSTYVSVMGTYQIHKDIDLTHVFAPFELVLGLSGLTNKECTSIDLYPQDGVEIDVLKQRLREALGAQKVWIDTAQEQNKTLFAILSSEKLMIIAILSFILLIAAFTISGTINLLMMEKKVHIYLLRTFGYAVYQIKIIFMWCGILYGIVGLVLGLILGTGVCLLQYYFHLLPIEGDFIIHYFPVQFEPTDYLLTTALVVGLTSLATYVAIWRLQRELNKNISIQSVV